MPTGPQYSAEQNARRKRIGISVDVDAMKHAAGAWKWAYENYVTDEPTFTDWINHCLVAYQDASPVDAPPKPIGRMYWIDRDKLNVLPESHATPSRSQVFRASVAAGVAEVEAEASQRGATINPVDRLPAKVWRD